METDMDRPDLGKAPKVKRVSKRYKIADLLTSRFWLVNSKAAFYIFLRRVWLYRIYAFLTQIYPF